jgi:hypothetical protein
VRSWRTPELHIGCRAPQAGRARRSEITGSPNQETVDQLRELPPAFIAVDEADILREKARRTRRRSAPPASQ